MAKENSPVFQRKLGALQIAAFENVHPVDGEDRTFLNYTIERSYKDRDDQWQNSKIQLSDRDLGNLVALAQTGQFYNINRSSRDE